MRIFRKGPGPDALAIAVVGVRMGNRLLDVGAGTARLFAALAGKVGLTGRAFAVVASPEAATRVKAAAARAGVLVDVETTAWPQLPVEDAAFDVAVLDTGDGLLGAVDAPTRRALAGEVLRALRPGGRVIVLERQPRGLLAALTGGGGAGQPLPRGEAGALLSSAGFKPVRLLAEREGQRFTEGWKTSAADSVATNG
jgi:ubiquinone/menaquinone biosynthesis C-methylase UbiE